MKLTQQEKILVIMARGGVCRYYTAPDFMRPELGDLFVGYEATARMSELVKQYPNEIKAEKRGKYRAITLNNPINLDRFSDAVKKELERNGFKDVDRDLFGKPL